MKFETLERRVLLCARIDFNDWIDFEMVGDWRREVTLGVPETYELQVTNTHPSCAIEAYASAANLFGGVASFEEASFEFFENSVAPIDYSGSLDAGEVVSFVMQSTPKFSDFATPKDPGQAIAEVLLTYGKNGDFVELSIVGDIHVNTADVDLDGKVGFQDFLVLAGNYGQQVDSYFAGDFDLSGKVDFADFLILAEHYGQTTGSRSAGTR